MVVESSTKKKKFQPDIVPTMTFEMMEELSVQERFNLFNNYSSLIKRLRKARAAGGG